MIHDCDRKTITVIQLAEGLDRAEVDRILFLANQCQHSFLYELHKEILPLADKYKLPNGGADLCEALESLLRQKKYRGLPRPLIALSSVPFGDRDQGNEPGWFFFYSQELDYDAQVAIISTQPLEVLPQSRTLENYLLMLLATDILCKYADMVPVGHGKA